MDRARLLALAPDLARGVRAAIATLVPFVLAGLLDRHELVWMALGGWLSTIADTGGARATRARILTAFALVGAGLVAAAQSVAAVPVVAVLVLAAVAFAMSMLRALGGRAGTLGTALLITASIATVDVGGSPLRDARWFMLGALWGTLLSSVVWPIGTHLPLRRAVGEAFVALAGYADALAEACRQELPAGHARWSELAREHRLKVRTAMETARGLSLSLRARRSGESRLGSNLRALLGDAERELTTMIALAEELELDDPRSRAGAVADLATISKAYRDLHDSLYARLVGADVKRPPRAREVALSGPAGDLLGKLLGASREALSVARAPDAPPSLHMAAAPVERPVRAALTTLRDALSPRAPACQHALKVAAAVAVAFAVGRAISPAHANWVTVTTIAVLQPFPGATMKRAIERVIGTVLGSILAAGIMATVHSPLWLAVLMFPLSVAAVTTQPRSYRLFTFFLTPVFVLLAARGQTDFGTAALRAGDAFIGGGIALVFALAVFPSWERTRLAEALAVAVKANAAYAEAVLSRLALPAEARPMGEIIARRRAVGVALAEAEASLERLLAEPRVQVELADDALQLVTTTRRLSAALTALDTWFRVHPTASAPTAVVEAVRAYVGDVLGQVAERIETPGRLPRRAAPEIPADLPPAIAASLERVCRQTQLVEGALRRES